MGDPAGDIADLVDLQHRMLAACAPLVRPGGRLVYSVCTLTAEESIGHAVPEGCTIDDRQPPAGNWQRFGHGWRVLPHEADTDGMVLVRYRRPHERRPGDRAPLHAKVLTVSDGVFHGARDDTGGRGLAAHLAPLGFEVVDHQVTQDGADEVAASLREMSDGFSGLIVTTGGTGFAPRDQTPEGTRAVIERVVLPGWPRRCG